MTQMYTE